MVHKLPGHQQTAPDIHGKGIVNDALGDGFDGVDAIHIAIGGIVDQNIHPTIALQHLGIDILHSLFIGNITFYNQIISAHFL